MVIYRRTLHASLLNCFDSDDMNNPLALFRNLRDLYLRYLDSPFDLRYADLVRERRALLDRDGYLWREPLIEPVPAYPRCKVGFSRGGT